MKTFSLISFILILGFSLNVSAQETWPTEAIEFKGTDTKKGEASIKKGIESAIDDMSFITRPIARGKLEKSNLPFKKLVFQVTSKTVSIQHDERKPIVTEGKPVQWTRDGGEKFQVTQVQNGEKLTQTFNSEDGKKVLVYTFSESFKKLNVDVLVTSGKISGPVKYTLHYVTTNP